MGKQWQMKEEKELTYYDNDFKISNFKILHIDGILLATYQDVDDPNVFFMAE